MQAAGGLRATGTSIVDVLDSVGRGRVAAPALIWRDSAWSYGDLLRSIAAVRKRLAGCETGTRVALLMRNSPQYVALYYGTLAAGCVAVPLNAQERAPVLVRHIEHSGASLVAGDSAHKEWQVLCDSLDSSVDVLAITLCDGSGAVDDFERGLGTSAKAPSSLLLEPNQLAAILYTSGTTGQPKGVMLSHGNLLSNALAIIAYLKMTTADRGLCVLPFHFSYGNSVLNSHLLSGATLFIEDNFAFPHVTLQHLADNAVTGFAGVPSTFALLLGRCRLQLYDLESLRYLTQAGGAMPRPMIERLRASIPGVRIFIMYGQTEATARLTYLPPERLDDRCGSVGIPIEGVEIRICGEAGESVPANTVGEIHARGPNVMLGYWNDGEATARVLEDDGWLRTGDLGHHDEAGFLYIDGRAVEMIKTGAFRVSPQEIEEVIADLTDVEEVAVAGIADDMLGQAILAVVVPRADSRLDVRAVKAHCHERLAAYKVPKIVRFTTTLPRTSSGKVQRRKLVEKINS